MKCVILAGGRGTRISEESHLRPKPMIEIGSWPILWHIMKHYSHHGVNEFIICLGYRGYMIKEYFANYFLHSSDVTLDLAGNDLTYHNSRSEPWRVTLVDTGEATLTGGRVLQVRQYLDESEPFFVTYGDGVADVDLAPGVFIRWGGQYENLQAASARLSIVIPLVFLLIFGILFMAVRGIAPAIAIYSAVPLGLAGGVFGLALMGLTFSISAAVGFIVLSGVTVLNGLVVMTSIRQRIDSGIPVDEAVKDGMMERVRAVLITGIVPAIGFIPMAIATGRGAEVQKPLAVVVIAGLIVATLLTLFVLPAISHLLLRIRRKRHAPGDYQDDLVGALPQPAE